MKFLNDVVKKAKSVGESAKKYARIGAVGAGITLASMGLSRAGDETIHLVDTGNPGTNAANLELAVMANYRNPTPVIPGSDYFTTGTVTVICPDGMIIDKGGPSKTLNLYSAKFKVTTEESPIPKDYLEAEKLPTTGVFIKNPIHVDIPDAAGYPVPFEEGGILENLTIWAEQDAPQEYIGSSENLTVQNCRIIGNRGEAGYDNQRAISVSGAGLPPVGFVIQDCYIQDFWIGLGIHAGGIKIRGNNLDNCDYGFFGTASADLGRLSDVENNPNAFRIRDTGDRFARFAGTSLINQEVFFQKNTFYLDDRQLTDSAEILNYLRVGPDWTVVAVEPSELGMAAPSETGNIVYFGVVNSDPDPIFDLPTAAKNWRNYVKNDSGIYLNNNRRIVRPSSELLLAKNPRGGYARFGKGKNLYTKEDAVEYQKCLELTCKN